MHANLNTCTKPSSRPAVKTPGAGFDPNNMGGNPNAGAGQQGGNPNDNVTDVDYEEVH